MRNLMMAVLVVLCLSWGGEGEAFTGNDLLEYCSAKVDRRPYLNGVCDGYIYGTHDTLMDMFTSFPKETILHYCPPKEVTTGQIAKVVMKYLEKHPEQLHEKADFLIHKAVQKAFPCPEKQAVEK